MRKNRMLSVAIAATLSLPVGVVYAGTFKNVNCTDTSDALTTAGCLDPKDPKPLSDFNLTSSLIEVPTEGTVYALELFGGGETSHPTLPNHDDAKKAAVLYTIDGGVDADFELIFALSDGVFAGHPTLGILDADSNYTDTDVKPDEGGSSAKTAKFIIKAKTNKKPLKNNDKLMLVYQFKDTNSLATQDESGKLVLDVSLVDNTGIPVNSPDTVTIATSKQAVKASCSKNKTEGSDEGSVKISVADDSKTFATGGTGPAFVSTTVAQIGYVEVTNVNASITDSNMKIKESNGENDFLIGQYTDGKVSAGSKDDQGSKQGSWLDITGGQFAASINSTNTVFINSWNNSSSPPTKEDPIKAGKDNVDETTAFFGLTDDNLQNIADEAPTNQATPVGIRLEVDDSTPINTVENAPTAELTIDFVESYVKDITGKSCELLQISKDGTVCVVYNLAGPNTADKYGIRITNTSGVPGKLFGRLYGANMDENNGVEIASGNLNGGNVIQPWETVVFNTSTGLGGFTWEGRANLVITSTLPSLEVMGLSRHINPGSPLSEISTGATGVACYSQ